LRLERAQKQWGKTPATAKGKNTYEIDLIANNGKNFYAFEFKYKELEHSETLEILEQLIAKAKFVQKLPTNVRFGIVAKKIEQKEKLRAARYLAYDLDDF
jgi:uncharacterized protein YfcZ (UPF0381/DUF406 family)